MNDQNHEDEDRPGKKRPSLQPLGLDHPLYSDDIGFVAGRNTPAVHPEQNPVDGDGEEDENDPDYDDESRWWKPAQDHGNR